MPRKTKKKITNIIPQHGDDPADTDSLFDQHGASREKGNDNNKYPLYVRHGDDKNDIITELKIVGNIIAGYQKNQDYPLYVSEGSGWKNKPHFEIHEDGYGQYYHHPQCSTPAAGKARPKSDDTYPLYIEQDVYDAQRLDKVSKTDRNPETRPEAVYPVSTDGQRISLTPFPGSVEIKPMNGKDLGCWRCIPATCQKLIDANMLVVKKNKKGEYKIYQKQYANYAFDRKTGTLVPTIRTTPIRTILIGFEGSDEKE